MITTECSTCYGRGYVMRLQNSYNEYDEPYYGDEMCDDCGGTGREIIEEDE